MGGKMFRVPRDAQFWMEFDNGYAVSIAWWAKSYSDNWTADFKDNPRLSEEGSNTAEVVVFRPDGELADGFPHKGDPWTGGENLTAQEVLDVLNWAAKREPTDLTNT